MLPNAHDCSLKLALGRLGALIFGSALMIAPATGSPTPPTVSSNPSGVFLWERQADLPGPFGWKGMYAGVSEGRVLLAGGSNFPIPPRDGGRKVLSRQILMRPIHAPRDEGWTVAEQTLATGRAEGASVSTEAGVVMLGGLAETGPVAEVLLLHWDASKGIVQTRPLPPLPAPLASPAAVYWRGQIFVAGGEQNGRGSDGFWSLDLKAALAGEPAGNWEQLPSWPGPPRFGAALAVLDVGEREHLFLLGGRAAAAGPVLTDYLNDVYRYDPVARRWTSLSLMPHRAVLAGCIRVGASRLALLGGSDGHDLHRNADLGERYRLPDRIMLYDANSDRWSAGGSMPLGVVAAAVVELGHDWLVAGGEYSPGLRTIEVYRARLAVCAAADTLRTP
jgi:N-acetylneuraminic acid mutarotase